MRETGGKRNHSTSSLYQSSTIWSTRLFVRISRSVELFLIPVESDRVLRNDWMSMHSRFSRFLQLDPIAIGWLWIGLAAMALSIDWRGWLIFYHWLQQGPRNLGFQSTLCLLCYELCWKAKLKIQHPLETFIVWTFFETFHTVPKELNRKVDELEQNNKWRLRALPWRQAVHQAVVNQKLNSPPIMWRQLLLWESSTPDRIMTFP